MDEMVENLFESLSDLMAGLIDMGVPESVIRADPLVRMAVGSLLMAGADKTLLERLEGKRHLSDPFADEEVCAICEKLLTLGVDPQNISDALGKDLDVLFSPTGTIIGFDLRGKYFCDGPINLN